MSRLPVEQLPARLKSLDLSGTEVHHLPDWKGYEDPKRLQIIRQLSMMRGRDPRIASLAVSIIRKAKVKPRDYKGQAAALLAWVQNPKNIYYVNEPGERLQDPIFTIKQGWGDCDDQVIVLAALYESIRLPWKLVLGGTCRGRKVRHIEGDKFPRGCKWAHIYLIVGTPPFKPNRWYFAETTIQGVPLGWDVVSGSKKYLPEMDVSRGPSKIVPAPPPPRRHRPPALPRQHRRSPAYLLANGVANNPRYQAAPSAYGVTNGYGVPTLSPIGAAIGASLAVEAEEEGWFNGSKKKKAAIIDMKKVIPAVITGVSVAVSTQLILDYVRPRLFKGGQK